jgi:hypothetical protein
MGKFLGRVPGILHAVTKMPKRGYPLVHKGRGILKGYHCRYLGRNLGLPIRCHQKRKGRRNKNKYVQDKKINIYKWGERGR